MKAPLSERQGSDRFKKNKKSNKNLLTAFKKFAIINLQKQRKPKGTQKKGGMYYDQERNVRTHRIC